MTTTIRKPLVIAAAAFGLLGSAVLGPCSSADAFPGGGTQGGGPGGPGHRPPSFEQLDADGDGVVTFEEFLAPMQARLSERWTMLDADGDSQLTIEEFEAGAPRRGRGPGGGRPHGSGDGDGLRGGQPSPY